MWMFIQDHTEQMGKLNKNRLHVLTMDILHPFPASGIAFPQETTDQVLSLLGLEGKYQTAQTDVDGVMLISFGDIEHTEKRSPPKECCVKISSWEGASILQSYFENASKQILLPIVGKDIIIHVPDGRTAKPRKDADFHIFLFSSYSGSIMIDTPKKMFSNDAIDGPERKSFLPVKTNGESFLIIDECSGFVAAELIENNLYIHYNITQHPTRHTINIFECILKRVSEFLQLSQEEKQKRLRNIAQVFTHGIVYAAEWYESLSKKKSFVEAAQKALLPLVQKSVIIHVPKGEKVDPIDDGLFHIFIWSTINENNHGTIPAPERIFGLRVYDTSPVFQPFLEKGDSVVIYDKKTDYAVAELIGNNLFIHHYICYSGEASEVEMFKRIFEALPQDAWTNLDIRAEIQQQQITEKEQLMIRKEEAEKKEFAAMKERAKPLYVHACRNRLAKIIGENSRSIAANTKTINEKSLKIITVQQSISKIKKRICETKEQLATTCEFLDKEFDRVLSVPNVIGVTVEKTRINIFTDMIKIPLNGNVHLIGQFRIEIHVTSSAKSLVMFYNITNRGYGPGAKIVEGFDGNPLLNRHHPYVNQDGIANLGKLTSELPLFIGENQIAIVANLLIQFLRKVNPNDYAGKGLKFWPIEGTAATITISSEKTVPKKRKRRSQKSTSEVV